MQLKKKICMYNSLQPANQAEPAVLDAPVVPDASVVQADPVAAEAIALCTRMLAAQVCARYRIVLCTLSLRFFNWHVFRCLRILELLNLE